MSGALSAFVHSEALRPRPPGLSGCLLHIFSHPFALSPAGLGEASRSDLATDRGYTSVFAVYSPNTFRRQSEISPRVA